ncbi:unnamed protein product [Amoebophrya sp. A120]|nr:unnamed protein product [Amoebophrya sp. A120]|eukprot:GSA120T00016491001.1
MHLGASFSNFFPDNITQKVLLTVNPNTINNYNRAGTSKPTKFWNRS